MAIYYIDYDPNIGTLTDDSGLVVGNYIGANLALAGDKSAYSQASDALELVKQGMTADDLVKLRNMGII